MAHTEADSERIINGHIPFRAIVWRSLVIAREEAEAREARGEPPIFVMPDIAEDSAGLAMKTFSLPLQDLMEEEDDG